MISQMYYKAEESKVRTVHIRDIGEEVQGRCGGVQIMYHLLTCVSKWAVSYSVWMSTSGDALSVLYLSI